MACLFLVTPASENLFKRAKRASCTADGDVEDVESSMNLFVRGEWLTTPGIAKLLEEEPRVLARPAVLSDLVYGCCDLDHKIYIPMQPPKKSNIFVLDGGSDWGW